MTKWEIYRFEGEVYRVHGSYVEFLHGKKWYSTSVPAWLLYELIAKNVVFK